MSIAETRERHALSGIFIQLFSFETTAPPYMCPLPPFEPAHRFLKL